MLVCKEATSQTTILHLMRECTRKMVKHPKLYKNLYCTFTFSCHTLMSLQVQLSETYICEEFSHQDRFVLLMARNQNQPCGDFAKASASFNTIACTTDLLAFKEQIAAVSMRIGAKDDGKWAVVALY